MFHRIDDMWEIDAARFFRLARRLPAYGGAVAAALNSAKQEGPTSVARTATSPQVPQASAGARAVGASQAELRMSNIGGLFSFGVSGG